MAFPHGTARCWTSREGEWREVTACYWEGVRDGQSDSSFVLGNGHLCSSSWWNLSYSILSLSLLFAKTVISQITRTCPENCDIQCSESVICNIHMLTSLDCWSNVVYVCLFRVEEAYRRISGPACVTVDASPPADQVLQQVLLLIRAKCHL